MLRRTTLILGTALLMLTASIAQAQTPKGKRGQQPGGGRPGGGFGGGVTTLLASPEVLKELNVSSEQKGLIEDMLKDLRPAGGTGGAGGGNRQDFQNLSQEERQKRVDELRKQGEERAKKADDMVKVILEAKQVDRLNQLRLQTEGVGALSRAEVADKVGLTQEQKDKIAKIREAARPDPGSFQRGGNASQEDRQKAAQEFLARREKTNAEVLAVLTPTQKDTWDKMQGKKFDFPAPARRGGAGQ